ncbi:hypothetical protein MKQ70_08755 [Chitinophaga sedimenti]|nr:hypothetical protein [Chitinophaga sedimenti]MCK7555093.1 hypothetical protein [Chitinophaga sedimenti]
MTWIFYAAMQQLLCCDGKSNDRIFISRHGGKSYSRIGGVKKKPLK